MKSQNLRIKNHLESGKSITAIQALTLFQCFRLAARINDLKNYPFSLGIQSKMVSVSDKRVAEYWL